MYPPKEYAGDPEAHDVIQGLSNIVTRSRN
jgi:hypothetical protein